MPTNPMPIPSLLSIANKFKINFLTLYSAITFYANTFTFIKCQSLQNQFSPLIQCHQVLRQYLHFYQVPISSKSIFSPYTMPSCLTPIPSHLSSANQFKINFLLLYTLYNAVASYTNMLTDINSQLIQNEFSPFIFFHKFPFLKKNKITTFFKIRVIYLKLIFIYTTFNN